MSHGSSVPVLKLPELVSKLFVKLSIREIVGVSYQEKRQLTLSLMNGTALKQHTSFR
jgi:hypothetical protein